MKHLHMLNVMIPLHQCTIYQELSSVLRYKAEEGVDNRMLAVSEHCYKEMRHQHWRDRTENS
jgi:hypothetical protein